MGIACQRSCYLIPDSYVKGPWRHKLKMAAMRKKLVERRKKQMDGILEEAQLWAVLMLLPTRFVSKDSEVNRAAEGVNRTLLGDHIEKEKINRKYSLSRPVLGPRFRSNH